MTEKADNDAITLYDQVLQNMEAADMTEQQKKVLKQVIPVLLEGLPELLRKLEQQRYQKSGELHCNKPIDELQDIEPLRFLGQFLFRHNPNFERVDPPALRHKLKQYAEDRLSNAPKNVGEKMDDEGMKR